MSLSSERLLKILFSLQCTRRGLAASPQEWVKFSTPFAERFEHLSEELRVEVLVAHLQSVEDVDVYDPDFEKRHFSGDQSSSKAFL